MKCEADGLILPCLVGMKRVALAPQVSSGLFFICALGTSDRRLSCARDISTAARAASTTSRITATIRCSPCRNGRRSAAFLCTPPIAISTLKKPTPNLKFEREDWTLFRTIDGLQQTAGVPKDQLPRLGAQGAGRQRPRHRCARSRSTRCPRRRGYFVEDDGPGIDGTPEDIARLFSINRPMISTKLLRLPTRGALGNGLRVVAGAVLASAGTLIVITRNRRIELRPERDGTTTVVSVKTVKFPVGTRVEISFGPALPVRC